MKICNIAFALAYFSPHFRLLALAAKPNSGQEATYNAPAFDAIVAQAERRYIVTWKAGSRKYNRRLQNANSSNRDLRANIFSTSTPLFLPKDNAEVMYLYSDNDVQRMSENEEVESVELDEKRYLMAETTPYGITNVKALIVPDSDVSNRKVCIIDTGFDILHPDLASDSSVVTGYGGSFSAGPTPWSFDGNGHGTHVAGTIAAIGGNDQGVVGVNRNGQLKLHIVKVFGDDGYWAWGSTLVAAMEECVDAGANVVNMSLGGGGFSNFENNAVERITDEDGVLLIAAAGNGGNNAPYSYPASYSSVMSVAAVDSNNVVAGFSQKNDQVDIAAPGVGTMSTVPLNTSSSGYGSKSGTSMASPHVAGVAALVWSAHTTKTNKEIRQALESSAQDLGAEGRDNTYGHGLVRADLAAIFLDNDFTGSPTMSPTPAPPCTDNPEGWFDSDGAAFDCDWYSEGSNCQSYGDDYANNGVTANMACCACGGGSPDTPTVPTKSPVSQPSSSRPSNRPTKSPVLPGECPSGQAMMELEIVTDSNGRRDNVYKVMQRRADGKFKTLAWKQRRFPNNEESRYEKCLDMNGCYKSIMVDKATNGMCCEEGNGGYIATYNGQVVKDTLTDLSFTNGKASRSRKFGQC